MKTYKQLQNGEKQKCVHCGESRERGEWFLHNDSTKDAICDFCKDNNKPCSICNKLKSRFTKYEVNEVICLDCKKGMKQK